MSLQTVIESIAGTLRDSAGVDQVFTDPPAKLPDDQCFMVYPDPGGTTLQSGSGKWGNVTYNNEDDILIDFHIKAARDAMAETEPKARAMLETFRDVMMSAIKRNAFAGVIAFRGLVIEVYGPLEYWNADTSFGFQARLSITHSQEATSGKNT